MPDDINDITNLNELQLTVPKDGTPGLIEGNKWRLPWGMDAKEETLRSVLLCYEPVRTASGKLVDIVAWQPSAPDRWYRLTGHLPLLGAEELERVSWTTLPCYVVDTPARWRNLDRRDIASICMLDWVARDSLFELVWGTIITPDEAIAAQLPRYGANPVHIVVAPIP